MTANNNTTSKSGRKRFKVFIDILVFFDYTM